MNWEHWEQTGNTLGDKNNPIFKGYLLILIISVPSVPSFFTPYLFVVSPPPTTKIEGVGGNWMVILSTPSGNWEQRGLNARFDPKK
jgi:hypothetical protein